VHIEENLLSATITGEGSTTAGKMHGVKEGVRNILKIS